MSHRSRAMTLAAALLTATLAGPAGAIAARVGDTPVVATERGGATGWFAALFESAWGWLEALVDQDNGNITP
jgi:hypothetical protein